MSKTPIYRTASIVLSLFVLAGGTFAQWQNIGSVSTVSQPKPEHVVLGTSSRAAASLEFFDRDVIRVRIAPSGKFEREFTYAFDPSTARPDGPEAKVTQTRTQIILTSSDGAKIVITRSPFRPYNRRFCLDKAAFLRGRNILRLWRKGLP